MDRAWSYPHYVSYVTLRLNSSCVVCTCITKEYTPDILIASIKYLKSCRGNGEVQPSTSLR